VELEKRRLETAGMALRYHHSEDNVKKRAMSGLESAYNRNLKQIVERRGKPDSSRYRNPGILCRGALRQFILTE
jgi:hypothetical protein